MTATDELRRLLDERGVESWDMQTRGLWFGITGNDHKYEAHEQRDGLLLVEAMSLTPEQAIAATLSGDDKSRWHELFGTPESAARTLVEICESCKYGDCVTCGVPEWACYLHDYDALLEWLRGEGES